jgi:hypothetical protein
MTAVQADFLWQFVASAVLLSVMTMVMMMMMMVLLFCVVIKIIQTHGARRFFKFLGTLMFL